MPSHSYYTVYTCETKEFTGVPTFRTKAAAVNYAKRKAAELKRSVAVTKVVRLSFYVRTEVICCTVPAPTEDSPCPSPKPAPAARPSRKCSRT